MPRTTIYLLLIGCLPLVITACSGDHQEEPAAQTVASLPAEKALLGTWETVEIEVDYVSLDGGDSIAHEIIREADFAQLYGSKPPQTALTPDGKLKRTHRFSNGEVSDVVNGLWKVHNEDTLLFIEPSMTLYFDYNLSDDRLVLKGLTDADADGVIDDQRRTVMRLIARDTYDN